MKYLFSLMILVLMSISVDAQKINTFTGSDTIVNTATVNLDYTHSGSFASGAFQVTNTRLSGTAAGNTIFQASVDGINYVNLDTLVNTNAVTNTKIFTQTPPIYPYYRITTTGSGTMSVITSAKVHFKSN